VSVRVLGLGLARLLLTVLLTGDARLMGDAFELARLRVRAPVLVVLLGLPRKLVVLLADGDGDDGGPWY
jgi:hypothetical protein